MSFVDVNNEKLNVFKKANTIYNELPSLSLFQNDDIPGLMYFISAVLLIISSFMFCMFPETKDNVLDDTFRTSTKQTKGEVEVEMKPELNITKP